MHNSFQTLNGIHIIIMTSIKYEASFPLRILGSNFINKTKILKINYLKHLTRQLFHSKYHKYKRYNHKFGLMDFFYKKDFKECVS